MEVEIGKILESQRVSKDNPKQLEDISKFHKLLEEDDLEPKFAGEVEDDQDNQALDFDHEIDETIKRGLNEGHSCNDINREITSLKLTENKTFCDCINSSVPVILKDISDQIEGKDGADIVKNLKAKLNFWKDFFFKFCVAEEQEMVALLNNIEVRIYHVLLGFNSFW